MATTKQPPIHKIGDGTAIQAAIWQQETEQGPFLTVSVSRLYKQGEEWKRSTSFGEKHLDAVIDTLIDARDWMKANPPAHTKTA